MFGVDILLAGQSKQVDQTLEGTALALVARLDLGIHQIQHGTKTAGRHPDLVQLLRVFNPMLLANQLLEPG